MFRYLLYIIKRLKIKCFLIVSVWVADNNLDLFLQENETEMTKIDYVAYIPYFMSLERTG